MPNPTDVQIVQRSEEEWRRADQLSLFLLVGHHLVGPDADWHNSLSVSTYNSIRRAGFADAWASPLRGGPQRHPLLDGQTISNFVTLNRDMSQRGLAQATVRETYAWDWLYRSEIFATGISFRLSLHDEAMNRLIEKVRVGEYEWSDNSTSCSFAVRLPVRREFVFPEPRSAENPYSEGPFPKPLREIAKVSAGWIEVAALDSKRIDNGQVDDLPLAELFADAGPLRISLSEI